MISSHRPPGRFRPVTELWATSSLSERARLVGLLVAAVAVPFAAVATVALLANWLL